jgi:hypothetical protein
MRISLCWIKKWTRIILKVFSQKSSIFNSSCALFKFDLSLESNLYWQVSEASKDLSSETTKLEQLLAFSCGHHYAQSVFYQSVLPELELGLLQLHHPLPNTARVLKGLFCSNSPNLHLACPRCVLSYLQSETTPPL